MRVGRAGWRDVIEEDPALAWALTAGSTRVTSSPVAGRTAAKNEPSSAIGPRTMASAHW